MKKDCLKKEEVEPTNVCCPKCGSMNVLSGHRVLAVNLYHYECLDCHHRFYLEKK